MYCTSCWALPDSCPAAGGHSRVLQPQSLLLSFCGSTCPRFGKPPAPLLLPWPQMCASCNLQSIEADNCNHLHPCFSLAADVCIVGAVRTPFGAFQGALRSLTAPQLGGLAIRGVGFRAVWLCQHFRMGRLASHIWHLLLASVWFLGLGGQALALRTAQPSESVSAAHSIPGCGRCVAFACRSVSHCLLLGSCRPGSQSVAHALPETAICQMSHTFVCAVQLLCSRQAWTPCWCKRCSWAMS